MSHPTGLFFLNFLRDTLHHAINVSAGCGCRVSVSMTTSKDNVGERYRMKKLFRWFRSKSGDEISHSKPLEIEADISPEGGASISLTDTRQVIGSTTQLPASSIDEMEARKHDLEYQLGLTHSIIEEKSILPYPFERSVILLRKAKRYEEELEICCYIEKYCKSAEANWDKHSAMIWKSPRLEKCVARIPKIQELIAKSQT